MLLKALWWEGQVTPAQDSSPQELYVPPSPRARGYPLGLWELRGSWVALTCSHSTLGLAFTQGFHVLAQWTSSRRGYLGLGSGEGPNHLLKLSLRSSPAGCENASEGSAGSGRRRGDLLRGPHHGLIRGVVPGRAGPQGQQRVCDTPGWHPPHSHHPLGACQPARGGAQVRS